MSFPRVFTKKKQVKLPQFTSPSVLSAPDNRPPGMVAAKARYMGKDLRRLAEYFRIPLQTPSNVSEVIFVKGSLSAMRLLMATKSTSQEHVEVLSRQLWKRIWGMDQDITEERSLREACKASGIDQEMTDNLIGQIGQPEVKEELKRSTQEALDLGAFGAPFIVVHVGGKPERFFGSDRFELIAHILGEKWEGPLLDYAAKI
jgi:glutathione S-transferase kappa 1